MTLRIVLENNLAGIQSQRLFSTKQNHLSSLTETQNQTLKDCAVAIVC